MQYTSKAALLGHPLIDIKTSQIVNGKVVKGVARGWFAVGDIAIGRIMGIGAVSAGCISVGGLGIGVVCISGIGVGIVSLAGLAISGVLSLGGCSISGGWAYGGLAIGGHSASGGLAIGTNMVEGGRVIRIKVGKDNDKPD